MATLQRIRNRAGLLIAVIIGMAIFAFVIQDLLSSGNPGKRKGQYDIAEIDGKTISYQEYQAKVDRLGEYYRLRMGESAIDEETMESIREQVWQDIVREYTTADQYIALGISVSTDELMDMVQGRNPHPIIQSIFTDPETGIFNRSFLVQFIRTMNEDPSGQQKTIWLYLEKEIIKDREFSKYNTLISKGLNVTGLEVSSAIKETSRKADISFVIKRYNTIADSMITVKDSDLNAYYKEHQNEFKQDAAVDLEYVVFDVVPTPEDDQAAREWIDGLKDEFENEEDIIPLVNLESDIPFDDKNYKYGELSDEINEFIFNAKVGDVYGVYTEDDSYRMARLVEINYLPDSVRARHILIQPSQTRDYNAASVLADSLKTVLDNGADFFSLAIQFSDDGSASQGGDLGWFPEGAMVKPFNDACFSGDVGEIQLVESQFGFHIIEVLEKGRLGKTVKVAFLSRKIEPSSATYQSIYTGAIEFAGKNTTPEKFNQGINELGLTKRYADGIQESQKTITGLESPREMIRWAFDAEENEVSDIFEFGNSFVVAMVASFRKEGIASLQQVRSQIELEVKNQKKAEIIIREFQEKISDGESFENIASNLGLPVQEALNINFSSVSIPSAGIEPKVVATVANLAENSISSPIRGNSGVFLINVNSISEDEPGNTSVEKSRMMMMRQSQANFEAYTALQDAANIKDRRSKFF